MVQASPQDGLEGEPEHIALDDDQPFAEDAPAEEDEQQEQDEDIEVSRSFHQLAQA